MKKSILNLGTKLTAVEQKEINGGTLAAQPCDIVCASNYSYSGRCGFSPLSHCPGACNGRGGYIFY